jgi:excisionase family DNA binding protein
MATKDLLTTAQVAKRLGVDVRTIHRWVKRGTLTPALKATGIRGPLFFDEDDVKRLKTAA